MMHECCVIPPLLSFSSDIQFNDLRQGVHVGTESVAGEWSNIEFLN